MWEAILNLPMIIDSYEQTGDFQKVCPLVTYLKSKETMSVNKSGHAYWSHGELRSP